MELLECDRWRQEHSAGAGGGRMDFGWRKMEGRGGAASPDRPKRATAAGGTRGWLARERSAGLEGVTREEEDKEGWEERADRILGGEGRRSGGWRQVPCVSLENSHHRRP